jgi:hypothetical protein
MSASPSSPSPHPPRPLVAEVRYSLADLLEQIKVERTASSFAMERLDQHEIGKLFKAKPSRAKRKK